MFAAPGGAGGAVGGSSGANAAGGGGGGPLAAGGSAGSMGPSGNAGAAGSGGAYDPCPKNGDACRLMPLGDSITDGYKSSTGAGYRLELFRLSLSNSKKLTFVGSHGNGPATVDNVPFPKSQEGHSGWTISDIGGRQGLQKHIVEWLKATPPNIIALMIGTNDMGVDGSNGATSAPARLATLVDTITTTAPDALLILAQIVPTKDDSGDQRVLTYNATMPKLVEARVAAGKHIVLIDMHTAFTQNANWKNAYMADGLHPNDTGYGVMANTWWPAIRGILPSK